MKKNFVYAFAEGDGHNKKLLGGKGANLCEMTQIGLNVPPGFVITTEACRAYLAKDSLPPGLMDTVGDEIGNGEIDFVADAADQRQRKRGDVARQRLVVETPQVLERAAAAYQ